jgi:hypothetical protein
MKYRNLADSTQRINTSAVQEMATFLAMDGCELSLAEVHLVTIPKLPITGGCLWPREVAGAERYVRLTALHSAHRALNDAGVEVPGDRRLRGACPAPPAVRTGERCGLPSESARQSPSSPG